MMETRVQETGARTAQLFLSGDVMGPLGLRAFVSKHAEMG